MFMCTANFHDKQNSIPKYRNYSNLWFQFVEYFDELEMCDSKMRHNGCGMRSWGRHGSETIRR